MLLLFLKLDFEKVLGDGVHEEHAAVFKREQRWQGFGQPLAYFNVLCAAEQVLDYKECYGCETYCG